MITEHPPLPQQAQRLDAIPLGIEFVLGDQRRQVKTGGRPFVTVHFEKEDGVLIVILRWMVAPIAALLAFLLFRLSLFWLRRSLAGAPLEHTPLDVQRMTHLRRKRPPASTSTGPSKGQHLRTPV